jgi:uncharacterized damage-inducible protein DinB
MEPAQPCRAVTCAAHSQTLSEQHGGSASEPEAENQMTIKDLEGLYDYGYWANQKLFEVLLRLTPEEFTRSVAGSFGSIRNTMVHMMSAEAGWLDRCGGPKRGRRLDPVDFPTVESLMRAWGRVETSTREFLATLHDEDLARTVEYALDPSEKLATPLGELMHHAANHGVHHRGQVVLLLRVLEHVPGDIDIFYYYAGKSSGRR